MTEGRMTEIMGQARRLNDIYIDASDIFDDIPFCFADQNVSQRLADLSHLQRVHKSVMKDVPLGDVHHLGDAGQSPEEI